MKAALRFRALFSIFAGLTLAMSLLFSACGGRADAPAKASASELKAISGPCILNGYDHEGRNDCGCNGTCVWSSTPPVCDGGCCCVTPDDRICGGSGGKHDLPKSCDQAAVATPIQSLSGW